MNVEISLEFLGEVSCQCQFSLDFPQEPKDMHLRNRSIGKFKLSLGVYVSVSGCLSFRSVPAMSWHVISGPHKGKTRRWWME